MTENKRKFRLIDDGDVGKGCGSSHLSIDCEAQWSLCPVALVSSCLFKDGDQVASLMHFYIRSLQTDLCFHLMCPTSANVAALIENTDPAAAALFLLTINPIRQCAGLDSSPE